MHLSGWSETHSPDPDMFYRDAFLSQIKRLDLVAKKLNTSAKVVGSHVSKSIQLPVVEFEGTHGRFLIRDNFIDINLYFEWEFPPDIPLEAVYHKMSWEQYLTIMDQKRKSYIFGRWTDEELEDPDLIEIQVTHESGSTYTSKVTRGEKLRWIDRYKSTEWYSMDWSSGKIIVVGNMGPGCKMYVAPHCFAEGANKVVGSDIPLWEPGMSKGIFSFETLVETFTLMKRINRASRL